MFPLHDHNPARIFPVLTLGIMVDCVAVWFLIQFASTGTAGTGGGVAYSAHVGGLAAGAILLKVFQNPRLVSAKRGGVAPLPRDLDRGGWW